MRTFRLTSNDVTELSRQFDRLQQQIDQLTVAVTTNSRTLSLAPGVGAPTVGGGGITQLSGDVTTPGGGSGVTTLATVATAGTSGRVTYNAKGLVTSGAEEEIQSTWNQDSPDGTLVQLHFWGSDSDCSGWGVSGGASHGTDLMYAMPHFAVKDMNLFKLYLKNNTGAPSGSFNMGFYSNKANARYPDQLLVEWGDQSPLGGGVTPWLPDLDMVGGNIYWVVWWQPSANINLSSLSPTMTTGSQLMGVTDTMASDPTIAWRVTSTYSALGLPTTFPAGATAMNQGNGYTPAAFACSFI